MATYIARQFVGVVDGTQIPALKADGRQIGASKGVTVATKNYTGVDAAAPALANTDKVFVGKLRAGELLTDFKVLSDTSFGAVTISLGTLTDATKYVNAALMTAVNAPTSIGPKASALAAGPVAADEDLYITVSGAVAAAVIASFLTEIARIH